MKISVSEEVKDNAKWRLGNVVASDTIEDFALIAKSIRRVANLARGDENAGKRC